MFKNFARAKEVHTSLSKFIEEMETLLKKKKIEKVAGEPFDDDLETYLREEIESDCDLNTHKPHGVEVYDCAKMSAIKTWVKRHAYLADESVHGDFREQFTVLTPVCNSVCKLEFKVRAHRIEVKYEVWDQAGKDFTMIFNKVTQVEECLKELGISIDPKFYAFVIQAKELLNQI